VKRIGRYILNGLTGLSLLLCLVTVGLWVRSCWVADGLYRVLQNGQLGENHVFRTLTVCSNRGRLSFDTADQIHFDDATPTDGT
jgi:hypothetical protein